MNPGHSLEAERQAILDRMQMRRESYRRMLTHGTDLDEPQLADTHQPGTHAAGAHAVGEHAASAPHALDPMPAQASHPVQYPAAPSQFPRSTLMRTMTEHPYLCALGVAAVVLIGPKRIARTVLGTGSTVSALAAGNQSHVDIAGKLLALAGAYVQGRSSDNR